MAVESQVRGDTKQHQLTRQPLNPSKNQIRILEVQPARDVEDRVVCRLVNVTLTEDLEFLAISSLLGDPSETENIVINGRKLPIPATLAQALRHVRAVFSQLSLSRMVSAETHRQQRLQQQHQQKSTNNSSSSSSTSSSSSSSLADSKEMPSSKKESSNPIAHALRHVRSMLPDGRKNKNSYSNDAGGLLPPQTRRGGPGGRRPSATAPSVLRVWLDFLCIDRQDARETSEQLMHMGKVYRAARMTIGWLGMNEVRTAGSESDSSSGSVDLTHMAAEVMRELEMALPANYGDPDDRAEHPENYHPVWQWQTRMQHLWGGDDSQDEDEDAVAAEAAAVGVAVSTEEKEGPKGRSSTGSAEKQKHLPPLPQPKGDEKKKEKEQGEEKQRKMPRRKDRQKDNQYWEGLRDFVDRPYFHRTWILDEIGMARYPALLVGDRLVSWAQVLLLNRVMEELRNEASYLEQVLSPELRAVVDGWPMGTIYTLLKHDESARKQQADKKQLLLLQKQKTAEC